VGVNSNFAGKSIHVFLYLFSYPAPKRDWKSGCLVRMSLKHMGEIRAVIESNEPEVNEAFTYNSETICEFAEVMRG
jgi:hypothetical protein